MSKWRVLLSVAVCLSACAVAPSAHAASPADCTPPTQERAGRAAGDDPAITAPTAPTCDDAGYDIAYPDAALETDPAPAATAPDVAPPAGRVTYPDYSLPRTDVDGHTLVLVLLALMALSGGMLVHVLVWLRQEAANHA